MILYHILCLCRYGFRDRNLKDFLYVCFLEKRNWFWLLLLLNTVANYNYFIYYYKLYINKLELAARGGGEGFYVI